LKAAIARPELDEWAGTRRHAGPWKRVAEQAHHAENLILYWRYCQDLVQARLASPRDDLPGDLARIYLQGDQTLTPDEIAGLVYGQLTAG
jgi:cytochrome P450